MKATDLAVVDLVVTANAEANDRAGGRLVLNIAPEARDKSGETDVHYCEVLVDVNSDAILQKFASSRIDKKNKRYQLILRQIDDYVEPDTPEEK